MDCPFSSIFCRQVRYRVRTRFLACCGLTCKHLVLLVSSWVTLRDHLTSLRLFVIFLCNRRLVIQISFPRVWKFMTVSKTLACDFLSLCLHLMSHRSLENGSCHILFLSQRVWLYFCINQNTACQTISLSHHYQELCSPAFLSLPVWILWNWHHKHGGVSDFENSWVLNVVVFQWVLRGAGEDTELREWVRVKMWKPWRKQRK